MAYVRQGGDKYRNARSQNLSSFVGSMADALGQAGVRKVQSVLEENRINKINDTYAESKKKIDSALTSLYTSDDVDPNEWESHAFKAVEEQIAFIETLDLP